MVSEHLGCDKFEVALLAVSKVPEPTRTIALMALLGIVLLGMLLIVVTMLGANWVRKQGAFRRGPAVPPDVVTHRRKEARNPPPAIDALSQQDTLVADSEDPTSDTVES